MNELILTGIIAGFTISLSLGFVFFVLMQTSLRHGTAAGVAFSAGVFLCDILIACILYFGLSHITVQDKFLQFVSIFGGIFLIVAGLRIFFQRSVRYTTSDKTSDHRSGYLRLFMKGFIVNGINPGVWIYWTGITGIAASYHYSGFENNWLIPGISACTIFICDIMKTLLASNFREKLNTYALHLINRFAGFCLTCSGAILILRVLNFM